jgi:hypothetical protein
VIQIHYNLNDTIDNPKFCDYHLYSCIAALLNAGLA